jgi:predicted Na+-dependent transporter
LVKSSKFPVTADDSFDGNSCVGCIGCVAVAAAVNGFDDGSYVAVTAAVAINSTIFSSKSLILKLKFFKLFKMSKSTTLSISFGIGKIRSVSLLIQLFINADL